MKHHESASFYIEIALESKGLLDELNDIEFFRYLGIIFRLIENSASENVLARAEFTGYGELPETVSEALSNVQGVTVIESGPLVRETT